MKINTMSMVLIRRLKMITYLKDMIQRSPGQLITYADYISQALYHSEYGYYMKDKQKIGREGDFITTSNISDIFGRIIAKWFSFIVKKTQLPPVFCEVGAGNGRFARAFLEEWQSKERTPITYIIVESSPYHRKLQNELLTDFDVKQAAGLNELAPFEGMIFSNELFDALPVHVVEKENGGLYEVMVGIENDQLHEVKVPLTDKAILQFLQENDFELNEKQRIEIPLYMRNMLDEMGMVLVRGLVTTVDYGYTHDEWMQPQRRNGSLRGYYQHQMIDNVLQHPGEMDITSHIHFDSLIKVGNQAQLHFAAKLRQDEFLLKAGILQELQEHFDPNPFSEQSKRNRAIRSLIMPTGMSSSFHVCIQEKNMKCGQTELFPN
jgi:SAM-dependent MidA family methyltransferase